MLWGRLMKGFVFIADLGVVYYHNENTEKLREQLKRECHIDTIERSGKVAAVINHMDQAELTCWRRFVQKQSGLRQRHNLDIANERD